MGDADAAYVSDKITINTEYQVFTAVDVQMFFLLCIQRPFCMVCMRPFFICVDFARAEYERYAQHVIFAFRATQNVSGKKQS